MRRLLPILACLLLLLPAPAAADPILGVITLQGVLWRDGQPYSGTCDFRVSFWDDSTGGTEIGSDLDLPGTAVVNGQFILNLDAGSAFSTGERRWWAAAVKCPEDADYVSLDPRHEVMPAPMALWSKNSDAANTAITSTVASTATTSAVADYATSAGIAITSTTSHATDVMPWSGLTGLSCAPGQVVKWMGSDWECQDDISSSIVYTAGVGTAGRVAEWITTDTLGSSNVTLAAASPYTLTVPANGTAALGTGISGTIADWATSNTLEPSSLISIPINTSASNNIQYGVNALSNIQSAGVDNTAIGMLSMRTATTATDNIGIGYKTLTSLISGSGNIAIGAENFKSSLNDSGNIGIGNGIGFNTNLGSYNVAVGDSSLSSLVNGWSNVAIGRSAGYHITCANANVMLGNQAGYNETGNNKLYIANSSTAARTMLYGDFIAEHLTIGGAIADDGATLSIRGSTNISGGLVVSTSVGGSVAAGSVYVSGNVSADSFTDRTPGLPSSYDALGAIRPITSVPASVNGYILDHSTLPAFATQNITVGGQLITETVKLDPKCIDPVELNPDLGIFPCPVKTVVTYVPAHTDQVRDLGAMVTLLTKSTQQLDGRYTSPPAHSTSPCTAGQYAGDATYFYFCQATNTWKRIAWSPTSVW